MDADELELLAFATFEPDAKAKDKLVRGCARFSFTRIPPDLV